MSAETDGVVTADQVYIYIYTVYSIQYPYIHIYTVYIYTQYTSTCDTVALKLYMPMGLDAAGGA